MYVSKAKEQHILSRFEWSELLDIAVKQATRSVLRGVGTARQSAPFNLDRAVDICRQSDSLLLPSGAPVGWEHLVLGTYFVMREIELALARVSHLRIDKSVASCTLQLPVSKKDPRALGCERTWQCLCRQGKGVRPDCPFHAAVSQLDLLKAKFGQERYLDLPLFPNDQGVVVDKAIVVSSLEATVAAYGDPITNHSGARLDGGHSFRVTGAQRLAASGVEILKS